MISHEYGHSLGLPDFYSPGDRETYGDWNLMATDKSQNMDAFSRQELGWVVPAGAEAGTTDVTGWTDSKEDTGTISWQTPRRDAVHPRRRARTAWCTTRRCTSPSCPAATLLDPAKFDTGDKATTSTRGCPAPATTSGARRRGGHNLDLADPGLGHAAGRHARSSCTFKSRWDIEWDYDYGYVLTSTDGGKNFTSHESEKGYTTSNTDPGRQPQPERLPGKYDNGITGTSGSYDAGTEAVDRCAGDYPDSVFLADTYDVSDLAGADAPVPALQLRHRPRPGPSRLVHRRRASSPPRSRRRSARSARDRLRDDRRPDDPRVFNGGCRPTTPAAPAPRAGSTSRPATRSPSDHAYYLEMRDRSGFDLDGKGQIDRDPIGFEPGSTSPTPTRPTATATPAPTTRRRSRRSTPARPRERAPDLNDAAFTAAAATRFSDSGEGHTDNYSDPSQCVRQLAFHYDCLSFNVLAMSGNGDAPAASAGLRRRPDRRRAVHHRRGLRAVQLRLRRRAGAAANTAPDAMATATPTTGAPGTWVSLDGAAAPTRRRPATSTTRGTSATAARPRTPPAPWSSTSTATPGRTTPR